MALSARELVLILRARDEASRAINAVGGNIRTLGSDSATASEKLVGVGSALLTLGTAMAGIGAVGTGFFSGAIDGAIDYSKAAALTLTQTGNVNTSLEELKQIGIDVSRRVPVAMGDIQTSLFDIFSTINTDVPGATKAVTQFAKAAVAGDAEISTVSRTTLSALNAWQRPVEDVSSLLDTQFRLVELGAGNYQEFASSIGLAIPTSVAAGQSFETLAGTMAFLTRQGLTTNRATTSTARAFELLTQPDVVKNLEDIGVKVKNSRGEFRQFDDIITQLAVNKGWAQMTDPQRKEAFQDIFGTGSIQARRFFDVAIPNFSEFNRLTDATRNSAGAMDAAYDIMFDEPAAKVQLLKNEYEAIRQEIGDQLIPAKLRLMEIIQRLFDAWNNLSPQTREMIVKFAAIASVVLLVVGTILAIVGGFLLFIGVVAPVVGGLKALFLIFGWVGVAILAVIVIGYLLIKHWDTVKAVALAVWAAVSQAFADAWEFIAPIIQAIWDKIQEWWDWMMNVFVPGAVALWDEIVAGAIAFKDMVVEAAQAVWDKLMEWWDWLSATFGPGLSQIWTTLVEEFNAVKAEVIEFSDSVKEAFETIAPVVAAVWDFVVAVTTAVWNFIWNNVISPVIGFITALFRVFGPTIVDIIKTAWDLIRVIIVNTLQFIWDVIKAVWTAVARTFMIVWDLIVAIVTFAIKFVSNIIQLVLNIIQGDWEGAWNNIKAILRAAWDLIFEIIRAAVRLVWTFLSLAWTVIWSLFRNGGSILWGIVKAFWQLIVAAFKTGKRLVMEVVDNIPTLIKDVFRGAGSLLLSIGKKIIQGLIDGITNKLGSLRDTLSSVTGLIPDWKGPLDVDKKLLIKNGEAIMGGLEMGLRDGWGDVQGFLTDLTLAKNFTPNLTLGQSDGGSNALMNSLGQAAAPQQVENVGLKFDGDLVIGNVDDIDELDWWAKKFGAGVG